MGSDEYQKIVDQNTPAEHKATNLLISFLVGGVMGLSGNFLLDIFIYYFHIPTAEAGTIMLVIFIFMACLLTAFGVFDNLVKFGKMGFIIPITGFAHSIHSAILDYQNEGPIYGFGANVFKLAGSVILYGIVSAYIFGLIRYILFGG